MAKTTRDRFFDAINETYDALLSVAEATEARGHKVSQRVFEEARKGEKEVVGLARQWVDSPTSLFDNLAAIVDVQAKAQQRALELARDSLLGADEYRADVQEALRRVIRANREGTEATVEAARRLVNEAVDRARGARGEAEPARRTGSKVTRIPVAAGESSGAS